MGQYKGQPPKMLAHFSFEAKSLTRNVYRATTDPFISPLPPALLVGLFVLKVYGLTPKCANRR